MRSPLHCPFWLVTALKNGLAKSVHLDEKLIKFDEVGVKAFAAQMPNILRQAGFKGIVLEILASFCTCSGLDVVYQNLLQTPHQLNGDEYEVKARVHLGFQAVQIFGTVNITASIKQIVSYVPYYVDKALTDASVIGLPITLANFNDTLMETAHKLNKSQSLLFSGGRTGPISKNAYQKQVIKQQFQNEAFQLTSRENTPQKSSSAKAERKMHATIGKEPIAKKVVITILLFSRYCS